MKLRITVGLATLLMGTLPTQAAAAPDTETFSDDVFARAQSQNRTIVVETYAEWCLPCKIQAPILERLRSKGPFQNVLLLRVGEKTPEAVWDQLRLHGFGILVVFRGGKEVARGSPTNEKAVAALLSKAF